MSHTETPHVAEVKSGNGRSAQSYNDEARGKFERETEERKEREAKTAADRADRNRGIALEVADELERRGNLRAGGMLLVTLGIALVAGGIALFAEADEPTKIG